MLSAFAVAIFTALASANPNPNPIAQAGSSGVALAVQPSGSAAGCLPSYDGTFQIQTTDVTSKRDLDTRQSQNSGGLQITLHNGIMMDDEGRTGYIASNSQFQFDQPPQAGAIYTSGWSVCQNNSLALGADTIFYCCLSGNFDNIYDENPLGAGQCEACYIQVIGNGSPVAGTFAPGPTPAPGNSTMMSASSSMNATSQMTATVSSTGGSGTGTQMSTGEMQTSTGATGTTGGGTTGGGTTGGGAASTDSTTAGGAAATEGVPMVCLAAGALAALAMF